MGPQGCLNLASELGTGLDMSHEGLLVSLPPKYLTLLILLATRNVATRIVQSQPVGLDWNGGMFPVGGWKSGPGIGNFGGDDREHRGEKRRNEREPGGSKIAFRRAELRSGPGLGSAHVLRACNICIYMLMSLTKHMSRDPVGTL